MKIPISQILISNRLRREKGEEAPDGRSLEELADSMRENGLINPILVKKINTSGEFPGSPFASGYLYELIAGERRTLAAKSLGWTEIDATLRDDLSPIQARILEMEENLRRLDMTWQEKALAVAEIHRLHQAAGNPTNHKWTLQMTGELVNLSLAPVAYSVKVAERLRDPSSPLWQCTSLGDAYDRIANEIENKALKEKRERSMSTFIKRIENSDRPGLEAIRIASEVTLEESYQRFVSNPHNDPADFGAYLQEKAAEDASDENQICLSGILKLGNCLDLMKQRSWEGIADAIITDPPYLLDLDDMEGRVDKPELGGYSKAIASVREEHGETQSRSLIQSFLPLAWTCLKDRGWLALWMNWESIHEVAGICEDAGFRVQFWPFVWCKTVGKNLSPSYNQTKKTEFCLIASKPGTVLCEQCQCNYVVAGHDSMSSAMKHPFAKPFAAWEPLIDCMTFSNSLILEPFAGEGSLVLSALRKNRRVIAIEKNEEHFNRLVEHVKKHYLQVNLKTTFI